MKIIAYAEDIRHNVYHCICYIESRDKYFLTTVEDEQSFWEALDSADIKRYANKSKLFNAYNNLRRAYNAQVA